MDFSNNKVANVLSTNNWSDALLIKDEKGNFGHLNSNKKTDSVDIGSQINHVSEGNLAPKDDSFLSIPNINAGSQDKAELVFHPEDKEELDFFAKNIPQDDSKKYSVEKIVDRIIEKQNLVFDEKNKKIFSNILYNFFRSRKSAVIIRELLVNSVLSNNKKLSANVIDNILSIIKGIKNKIDLAGGLVVNQADLKELKIEKPKSEKTAVMLESSASQQLSAQDEIKAALGELPILETKTDPVLQAAIKNTANLKSSLGKTSKPAEGFSIPAISEDIHQEIPIKKASIHELSAETLMKKQAAIKEAAAKIEDTDNQKNTETFLPKVSRATVAQSFKKPISDVVIPKKEIQKQADESFALKDALTGPIQELKSFDLVGFRRLGNTPKERIQKIFDKINLLEQESYTKKAQGIAAWRSSQAYKLYLQLGADSMIAGKEVAEFIQESERNNKATFTIEEFSAISDLNKQLRF
ncbi:MAG: hypothetical protein WCS88_01440 [Patescibacteria group bacterium]|jgi:hypothetical protein